MILIFHKIFADMNVSKQNYFFERKKSTKQGYMYFEFNYGITRRILFQYIIITPIVSCGTRILNVVTKNKSNVINFSYHKCSVRKSLSDHE